MATPQQEKRTDPRQAVKIPAKLHTDSAQIDAEALNLSRSGVFLECATEVSEGSAVNIVMILPKEVTGDSAKWVCCQATVNRVEQNDGAGRYGVAAQVEKIQAMPELTWPEVDRRVGPIRSGDRRKATRSEGQERRKADRRKAH